MTNSCDNCGSKIHQKDIDRYVLWRDKHPYDNQDLVCYDCYKELKHDGE